MSASKFTPENRGALIERFAARGLNIAEQLGHEDPTFTFRV